MSDYLHATAPDASSESRLSSQRIETQARIIDHLIGLKHLHNDAQLARVLGVTPATISKIRSGKLNVSPGIRLRILEVFGLPIAELRRLLGESGEAPGVRPPRIGAPASRDEC